MENFLDPDVYEANVNVTATGVARETGKPYIDFFYVAFWTPCLSSLFVETQRTVNVMALVHYFFSPTASLFRSCPPDRAGGGI